MATSPRRLLASLAALAVLAGASCTGDDGEQPLEPTSTVTSTTVDGVIDDIVLSDCPTGTDDAGVTAPRSSIPGVIRLATSHPTAGAWAGAAGASYGAQARFALENERGGVEVAGDRYVIEVTARNDAADPTATRSNVVDEFDPESDPAFAAFGVVGTDNVRAVQDQLTRWCVPDIFPISPSAEVSALGAWTVGAPVVLETTEAATVVHHLLGDRPQARLALLLPAGTAGDRLEAAFNSATAGTEVRVIASVRVPVAVDTDVADEVAALATSGADVFVDAAELLSCPAAIGVVEQLGWDAVVVAAGGCASRPLLARAEADADGVLLAANLVDPASDRWAAASRVEEYRDTVDSWADDNPEVHVDPDDPAAVLGWTMADLFVRALSTSTGASRSEFMAALTSLSVADAGLALDGITFGTGLEDRWLGESAQVMRFDADSDSLEPVGDVRSFEGGVAVPEDIRPGA